uniref:Neuronal pentraxin-2-like n=1 Tax=Poecilia reticulata TaxID=8081 RepID=A0A3P9NN38_POERE
MFLLPLVLSLFHPTFATSGPDFNYGAHPRFVCTPIPADADPSCFHTNVPPSGWWGASDEAKATILHLRESLVQQKEIILDQRETIRELTAKLTLCEGAGRGPSLHDEHHGSVSYSHHKGLSANLHQCKRNSTSTYSSSLKELLQRKISTLEEQLHHHTAALGSSADQHHDDDSGHRDDGDHHDDASNKKHSKNLDAFQISFPMRTNYMYGRMKRTLLQEIFALTLCLWMKAGVGPGLGTPFSYSAPGQANELVLIEWGNNPIELLIDDKAVTLPLSLSDGKWHHVCVTWTTRDGQWEAYQDGVQRGSGTNLSPWHSIKPGGVFILGQEQDTLGGRFDATQSYVGEMSDLHMWSHALSAADIYSLASCGSHLRGDVIDWSESEVELHGGVARYPFDPCH